MPNEIDIYQPRYMAEVVRTAPVLQTYFRDTFFTRTVTFATEQVDIDIVKGDRRMAAFVHPKAGGTVLKANGYETKSYKPPLVNPYDITTADRWLTRLPGETLYSGMTPAERAARQLVDDYNRLNDAATRREEWMCVQAVVTGKIPIVGPGVNEEIDFGFSNRVTLNGDRRWGQSAATVIDDLSGWMDHVYTNGFANVDMAILGRDAMKALLNDEDIYKKLDNKRMELGQISPRSLPNGVRYYGYLAEPGIDLYTYNEVYLDDWTDPENPQTKRLVPDDTVILISSNPGFMMGYGLCTYLENGAWVTAQSSRVLTSHVDHHPDRRYLELLTRPLPIPTRMDSWLVAKVC